MVLFLEFISGRWLGIGKKDAYTLHYYSDAEQATSEYDDEVYKLSTPSGKMPADIAFLLIKVYGHVTLLQPEEDSDTEVPEHDPLLFTPRVRVNSNFEVIKYDEGDNVRFVIEKKQQFND